jgi:hypothetical protein
MTSFCVHGAPIIVEPRPSGLAAGHIYVGVTEPARLAAVGAGFALVLNHKGHEPRLRSTTQYICTRPDEDIATWRNNLRLGENAADVLAGVTLVVEDASPDTCLAIAALVRRLRGYDLRDDWIDYASRWEGGDVHSTGLPDHSFGALECALVHPFFDLTGSADAGQGVVDGVAYTEALLDLGVDPANVPIELPISLHSEARTRLGLEHDRYLYALRAGTVVQLALPARRTGRRRLLDAIILSELEPTGTTKAWLRRDASSPGGNGYGLLALYRPQAAETGNDMTISVDPALGVDLLDLWCALEAEEDKAWLAAGEVRPRGDPRALNIYRDHLGCTALPCDQPWYDGGDLTLVAAPKALRVGGPPGTKLRWRDVLATLWRCYAPDAKVMARQRATPGPDLGLLEAAAQASKSGSLSATALCIADLVHAEPPTEYAQWNPTLERALAGCLSGAAPPIDQLPSPLDFDVFHERGGTVLVSASGVVLYEERSGVGFPAELLAAAAAEESATLNAAIILESHLTEATDRALRAIEHGDGERNRRALTYIYRIQMDARGHLGGRLSFRQSGRATTSTPDPMVDRVAEAMRQRWGSKARFEAVVADANDLADMVRSAAEARSATLLRNLTIYGFPAAILAPVLGDAFIPLTDKDAPLIMYGIAWGAIIAFVAILAPSLLVSRGILRNMDKAWTRDLRKRGVLSDVED